MTPDAPRSAPTPATTPPLPVVEALADPPEGVRPIADVAPSLASLAVAPEPPLRAPPPATPRAEVVDALQRLREALVSTGNSLDRVVAAAQSGATHRAPTA